jgi:hypothetical protein
MNMIKMNIIHMNMGHIHIHIHIHEYFRVDYFSAPANTRALNRGISTATESADFDASFFSLSYIRYKSIIYLWIQI